MAVQQDHSPPRRTAPRLPHDDGVEAPELALVGAVVVIAVLLAFPVLAEAVGFTFDAATTVMQSVIANGAD
jgi:hypothetical protein